MMREPLISRRREISYRPCRDFISSVFLFAVAFLAGTMWFESLSAQNEELAVGRNPVIQKSSFSCGANLEIGTPIFCGSGRIHSYSQDTYLCRSNEKISRSVCCICEKDTGLQEKFPTAPYFSIQLNAWDDLSSMMQYTIGGGLPENWLLASRMIIGTALLCNAVVHGEVLCNANFQCRDSPIDLVCPRNTWRCESDESCCKCKSLLHLRGGFNSLANPVRKPLQDISMQIWDKRDEPLPTDWLQGVDEEWSLPKEYSYPKISQADFLSKIRTFDALMNPIYMSEAQSCDPYMPANVGTSEEFVKKAKDSRWKLLKGWFGGNPSRVWKVGSSDISPNMEGIVVICDGNADNILQILETSWWGQAWKNMEAPPILMLLVHQDESREYLKMVYKLMTEKSSYAPLMIISHAARGFGPIRNKALGILKKKEFKSGVIIDENSAFIDSGRIVENGNEQSLVNMLQVLFDVISGDSKRAQRWRGSGYGTFEPQDFLSPMMASFNPAKSPKGFLANSNMMYMAGLEFSKPFLEDLARFGQFSEFMGLSRDGINAMAFENAVLWNDPTELFVKQLSSLKSELNLRLSAIEVRVSKRTWPKQSNDNKISFLTFLVNEMSKQESSFKIVEFDQPAFMFSEITYAMLAIYQWSRLNVDKTKDLEDSSLWVIFDGLYNQRKSLGWAKRVIKLNDIESTHPFRTTSPSKLISMYVDGNILADEYVLNDDPFNFYKRDPGPTSYFDDDYEITQIGLLL